MNNTKMIRTAKNLDTFVNVVKKVTFAMGIACIVIACLTLIFGEKMFTAGDLTLDLDFIKFHLNDHAYVNDEFIKFYVFTATLGGSVLCFLFSYVAKLLHKILSPMKIGRPFEPEISENLKKMGWVVLIVGLFSEVLGVIARMLLINAYTINELFVSPAIAKTEFVFTINFNFVLITCILFFLSYIFSYGQILQQDSDETL